MRRKIYMFLVICLISIIMPGCASDSNAAIGDKIIPPENNSIPIQGTWKVESFKAVKKDGGSGDEYIGMTAKFSSKSAHFGKELYLNPKYKIKYIDINAYIISQYKVNFEVLQSEDDIYNAVIVQVSSNDKIMYDIIKKDDNHIIMCLGNGFAYLTKVSDEADDVDDDSANTAADGEISSDSGEKDYMKKAVNTSLPESGVLLGIKQKSANGDISYSTLWIAYDKEGLRNIYKMEGIFVPRLSNFWNIVIERKYYNGIHKDNIAASQMSEGSAFAYKSAGDSENMAGLEKNISKEILFVSSNYISTKNTISDRYGSIIKSIYNVMPIDNISKDSSISITDLLGEEGKNAFVTCAKKAVEDERGGVFNESMLDEKNFAIKRRNGSWGISSSINTGSDDVEFNVNTVLPNTVLSYDDLYIPWNVIKSEVPDARDAYTAPNNKFAIIEGQKYIYVYEILNNSLLNEPIRKIDIDSGSKIIMAEWATGSYIYKWEDYVKINGGDVIK